MQIQDNDEPPRNTPPPPLEIATPTTDPTLHEKRSTTSIGQGSHPNTSLEIPLSLLRPIDPVDLLCQEMEEWKTQIMVHSEDTLRKLQSEHDMQMAKLQTEKSDLRKQIERVMDNDKQKNQNGNI